MAMLRKLFIGAAVVLLPASPVLGEDLPVPAFRSAHQQVFENCWSGGLLSADFNGDGHADVVFTDQHAHIQPGGWAAGAVHVLLGDGAGELRQVSTVRTYSTPKGLCAADFNNDGKLDLAVCEFYAETLLVMLGDGKGGFSADYHYDTVPSKRRAPDMLMGGKVKYNPIACAAQDFNGDGMVDIAVLNNNNGRSTAMNVALFFGRREAPGRFYQPIMHDPTNYFLSSLQVADVNADKRWDLVIGNYGDNGQLSINLGKGNGLFERGKLYVGRSDMGFRGNKPMFVQVADFDSDGLLDVAAAGEKGGMFFFRQKAGEDGKATGTFERGTKFDTEYGQSNCVAMSCGDFNGDGHADLAVTHQIGDSLSILSGDGKGGFIGNYTRSEGGGYLGQSVCTADLNGDRRDDLVVVEVSFRDPQHPRSRLTVLLSGGMAPQAKSAPRQPGEKTMQRAFERRLETLTKAMELTPEQKPRVRRIMAAEAKGRAFIERKWKEKAGEAYRREAGYRADLGKLKQRVDKELGTFLTPPQVAKYHNPNAPVPGLGGIGGKGMMQQARNLFAALNPRMQRSLPEKLDMTDDQKTRFKALVGELDARRGKAMKELIAKGDPKALAGLRDWYESELKQIVSTEQFEKYLIAIGRQKAAGNRRKPKPATPKEDSSGEDF